MIATWANATHGPWKRDIISFSGPGGEGADVQLRQGWGAGGRGAGRVAEEFWKINPL